jgi:formamidopyrimidine-DNA glycosylase
MPELPEVETVVRSIAPLVTGRTVLNAHFRSNRVTRGNHEHTAQALQGRVIQGVRRRGKQIFFDLDRGVLYVHLGMTGRLLWNGEPGKFARAVFETDGGLLVYDDIRMFGRVEYFEHLPEKFETGPDALQLDFSTFFERLRKRKGPIKPLLLNQSFISGVGNIYADESLFAARIHPKTSARRLSQKRAELLYGHVIEVLRLAIQHRGSSISNYVDACGNGGSFQQLHAVYGRGGEPCPACGTAIRRIVLGQRGTHYCPRCQRA